MSPAAASLHSCLEAPPDSLIRIFLPRDCRITNIAASNCTPSTLPDCQLWRGLEGNNGPEKPGSLLQRILVPCNNCCYLWYDERRSIETTR
jgi:hypothetical protein